MTRSELKLLKIEEELIFKNNIDELANLFVRDIVKKIYENDYKLTSLDFKLFSINYLVIDIHFYLWNMYWKDSRNGILEFETIKPHQKTSRPYSKHTKLFSRKVTELMKQVDNRYGNISIDWLCDFTNDYRVRIRV